MEIERLKDNTDLIKVIRCKDCIHWRHDKIVKYTYSNTDDYLVDFAECLQWSDYVTCYSTRYNDFCSLAELRENEVNSNEK